MSNIRLYGVILSPYVRKTRLALDYKGLDYEKVQVMPIPGVEQPAEFAANSPLGKIPLLGVDEHYINDSSVICQWLEREYPQPALLPENNLAAAKALWLEEYADAQMVPVIGGHLFAEVVLAKAVFNREPIQSDIDAALGTEIPAILTYLQTQLEGEFLLGNNLCLADLAVGSLFITLEHCNYQWDENRWPQIVAYKKRILATEPFASALAEERQALASFKG